MHLGCQRDVSRPLKKCFSLFLWSRSPHTTAKAKVAWEDCRVPKNEGSVLEDERCVTAFLLKFIWRLFEEAGLLWVAWLDAI